MTSPREFAGRKWLYNRGINEAHAKVELHFKLAIVSKNVFD